MACWRYIASRGRAPWGSTVQRHVPGSLQEVVPSDTEREWKETNHQARHDPENKFEWQGPHSEVPVMYWKHEI